MSSAPISSNPEVRLYLKHVDVKHIIERQLYGFAGLPRFACGFATCSETWCGPSRARQASSHHLGHMSTQIFQPFIAPMHWAAACVCCTAAAAAVSFRQMARQHIVAILLALLATAASTHARLLANDAQSKGDTLSCVTSEVKVRGWRWRCDAQSNT